MIKKKILSYKINRGLKKKKYPHRAYSYSGLKRVGVVFSLDDLKKYEAVKAFIKTMEKDGIEVKALAYKPAEKQNFEFYFDFFEDREVSFFGKVNSTYFHSFLEHQLEYLFCLDEKPNLYMQYLLVHAKSSTRIGAYQSEEELSRFFELMIKPREAGNTKLLTEEILHYVKKISGN